MLILLDNLHSSLYLTVHIC